MEMTQAEFLNYSFFLKILHPVDMALHSSAPEGRDHHIDVMVTNILMNISPASIRTITATLSSFSTSKVRYHPQMCHYNTKYSNHINS